MNEHFKDMTRDEIASELMYEDEFLEHFEALTAADMILREIGEE
jgi:hypothetical protein